MERRRESGSIITKQRELLRVQEYVMHMVLLTAGASASVLMVFLMEQWRAWVFIVLNLVLLSILFTSVSSSSSKQESTVVGVEADRVPVNVEVKKETTRQCGKWPPAQVEQVKECDDEEWFEVEDKAAAAADEAEEEVPNKLSKEALNERAEAFIVMFRQHLVTDARRK